MVARLGQGPESAVNGRQLPEQWQHALDAEGNARDLDKAGVVG